MLIYKHTLARRPGDTLTCFKLRLEKAILNAHPNLTIKRGPNMVRQHGDGLVYNLASSVVFSSWARLICVSWTDRLFP